MQTSNIVELVDDTEKPSVSVIDSNSILDFTISTEERLCALIQYSKSVDEEHLSETLNRIMAVFTISNSSIIKEYIIAICSDINISLDLRCEMAKNFSVYSVPDLGSEYYLPLKCVCEELEADTLNTVNTSKKVDMYVCLMFSQTYKMYAGELFNKFVNNRSVDSLFRYKTIMALKTMFNMRKMSSTEHCQLDLDLIYFQTSALLSFLTGDNGLCERILAAQYLLSQYPENNYSQCIDTMISICNNDIYEYKSRADAVDVILKYGTEEDKVIGKRLLDTLILVGNSNKKPLNIYQNPQNAHSHTIEESSCKILEMIMAIPLMRINNGNEITYDFVRAHLTTLDTKNMIAVTLNRIDLDVARYTKFNTTLNFALVYMYSFINSQEEGLKEILMFRLIEELSESSGLCSTGIFERIMNTVSGFVGDLKITISFEEQILGNLTGRLNARIRKVQSDECLHLSVDRFCNCNDSVCTYSYHKKYLNHRLRRIKEKACGNCYYCNGEQCLHICTTPSICNNEFMNLIIEEMIVPTHEYDKRRNFLKFFRYVLPNIIEELKEEFKSYIDDASFELYMRRAILAYEGEN
jgi:hypothetical protein